MKSLDNPNFTWPHAAKNELNRQITNSLHANPSANPITYTLVTLIITIETRVRVGPSTTTTRQTPSTSSPSPSHIYITKEAHNGHASDLTRFVVDTLIRWHVVIVAVVVPPLLCRHFHASECRLYTSYTRWVTRICNALILSAQQTRRLHILRPEQQYAHMNIHTRHTTTHS